MEHRGVVGHVGHSPLLAAMDRSLLIRRLVVQDTESATRCSKSRRRFVPRNLALVSSGSRVRGRITSKNRQAITSRVQLGAADAGDERINGGRGGRLDEGRAIARRLSRAIITRGREDGDVLRGRVRKDLMLLRQQVRIHTTFVLAEALGNDVAEIVDPRRTSWRSECRHRCSSLPGPA